MEALSLLESKIASMLELIKKLKVENGGLKSECKQLKSEKTQLIEEKTKLSKDNSALHKDIEQLTQKLKSIEESILVSDKNMDKLNQEKAETKVLIDDLLDDIDSIIEYEKQQ